jgi:hypothetical protein
MYMYVCMFIYVCMHAFTLNVCMYAYISYVFFNLNAYRYTYIIIMWMYLNVYFYSRYMYMNMHINIYARTIIVFLGGYNTAVCDAWAAIAVLVSILSMVVPLLIEIYKANSKIQVYMYIYLSKYMDICSCPFVQYCFLPLFIDIYKVISDI